MIAPWPITMWYSTFGMGDGHDFATRGYLLSLLDAGYEGIRIPPSMHTALMNLSEGDDDPSFKRLLELSQPPKHLQLPPVKRVEAGDPRIGEKRNRPWVDDDGINHDHFIEVVEGMVDPDVDQKMASGDEAKTAVECVVIHHDPASVSRIYGSHIRVDRPEDVAYVGITVWETSHIPDPIARVLSELDLLIVPSQHVRHAFLRSNVDVDIEVVPHTFDPSVWREPVLNELPKRIDDDRFVFYTIGTPIERKNQRGLLRAYLKAFEGRNDVLLRIKTINKKTIRKLVREVREELGISENPPIQTFTEQWPVEKMRAFHLAGDCFVSATRGEGFALCEFEAKLCNNRVITTNWGAAPELLRAEDFLVECHTTNVFGMEGIGPYEIDQAWAEPNEESLVSCMRAAEANRINKVMDSWSDMNDRYRPDVVGARLASILTKVRREVKE